MELERESLLQSLLESSGAAIFSVDGEYRYTSFNKQHAGSMKTLYGVDIQLGNILLDYPAATLDHVQAKANLDRALAGEHFTDEGFSGEDPRVRSYFEVIHGPVRDAAGCIVGASVFVRDSTARKRAELERDTLNKEFVRKNDELVQFTHAVSHDLKSPLVTIKTFLGYIEQDLASHNAEAVTRDLGFIRGAADKMTKLLDELLELSRLGTRRGADEDKETAT